MFSVGALYGMTLTSTVGWTHSRGRQLELFADVGEFEVSARETFGVVLALPRVLTENIVLL